MNIILAAPPFSGHLHPIIAIAKKLQEDPSFNVMIVSTPVAKKRVEQENIKFISILEGYDLKIEEIANPDTKIKSNPLKLFKQLKENISLLKQLKIEFKSIVEKYKTDFIISDFTLPIVGIVAKENKITWHTTLPSPCVYESNGVPAYMGGLYPPKNKFQDIKYKIYNKTIKVFKKICYYLFKKELRSLNLKEIYDNEGKELIYSPDKVYALGISELEFNHPKDKRFQYVGPVLYSPTLEQKEINFDNKRRYILVTMGTHLKFMKQELIKNIQLLAKSYPEIEFHITMGDDKQVLFKEIDNVKVINYISYEKYLSNYSYVIHHGGTGIIYECIKRAIPTIVFPQDYDQFDNAARLDYFNLAVKIKNYSQLFLCFERLLGDDKLTEQNEKYQKIYQQYSALDTIYQEVKEVENNYIKNIRKVLSN